LCATPQPFSFGAVLLAPDMKSRLGKPLWAGLKPGLHRQRVGTRPAFTAYVLQGSKPGPVALINGATHGDEYEGPTVLRELADQLNPHALRGTLVLVPVLHEDAFFAGTRCHPQDGSNLARVFPGKPNGNGAERVADLFLKRALAHADYYLDLHSGGVVFDLLPWCGYMITGRPEIDRVQAEICACFDDYWCWASLYLPGRTLSSAADAGVPAIYTESLGGGGVADSDRRALHRGIRNFLIRFGFLPGRLPRLRRVPVRVAADDKEAHIQTHHPAPAAGLFIRSVEPGDVVRAGTPLGTIHRLDRAAAVVVRAGHGGTVVSLRRKRSVEVDDAIATVVSLPR
jgi:predicted deacylase